MKLYVEIKNVYGNELIYPACDQSRLFAKLAGGKTITAQAFVTIQQLGYEFINTHGRSEAVINALRAA